MKKVRQIHPCPHQLASKTGLGSPTRNRLGLDTKGCLRAIAVCKPFAAGEAGRVARQDTLPEWSKGVDSSSTSASCVGSNPTGVIFCGSASCPFGRAWGLDMWCCSHMYAARGRSGVLCNVAVCRHEAAPVPRSRGNAVARCVHIPVLPRWQLQMVLENELGMLPGCPRTLGCPQGLWLWQVAFGISAKTKSFVDTGKSHHQAQLKYTWPGSNWRPSACEADVIATRPQVLCDDLDVPWVW